MLTENLYDSREKCCGCGACADVCPKKNIKMIFDDEGFIYPEIINAKCRNCGKCLEVCPVKHHELDINWFDEYYAGSLCNPKELISCASGGLATAITISAIKKNRIVYGVAYSADMKSVEYIRVTDMEGTERLKSSKYIQARAETVYKQLSDDLIKGREVVFFGLPCVIAATANRYRGYRELLYLVEIICHGPTSSYVHRLFCEMLESKYQSNIVYFNVRYKKDGNWKPYFIYAEFGNGKYYSEEFSKTSYGVSFLHFKRPSCNVCKIKGSRLQGDLMIGDYHYISGEMNGYNRSGVSIALVHNKRGKKLLVDEMEGFSLFKVEEKGALMNRAIHEAIPEYKTRHTFFMILKSRGLAAASSLPIIKRFERRMNAKNYILSCAAEIKHSFMKMLGKGQNA